MLHLGLTGLANGKTPFLSYRGPGKAKSFLRSIKGDWAILDDNITFKELRAIFNVDLKSIMFALSFVFPTHPLVNQKLFFHL